MEFSPEISVLQSIMNYASKRIKIGQSLSTLGKAESQGLIEIIHEDITDIVDGLEDDRTHFERKWWNSKLHAIFLYKTSDNLANISQNSLNLIGRHLPMISHDIYLELVKTFDWFGPFDEISVNIETTDRIKLYDKALNHVCQSPVNYLDLQLISSLIGQFILQMLNQMPVILKMFSLENMVLSKNIKLEEFLTKLLDIVSLNSDQVKLMSEKTICEFVHRLFILFPCVNNEKVLKDEISTNDNHHPTNSSGFFFEAFPKDASDQKTFEIQVENFPCVSWIKCLSVLLESLNAKSSNNLEELLNDRYFSIGNLTVPMKTVFQAIINNKDKIFRDLPLDLSEQSEQIFLIISQIVEIQHKLTEKINQSRLDYNVSSCIHRIKDKQPGFQDDLERLMYNSDIEFWNSEGNLNMLVDNPCVFYKEEDLTRLLEIYFNWYHNHPDHKFILNKFAKVIRSVFGSRPLVLQQKFILQAYLQSNTTLIIDDFISELTVTFNRFTSQPTKQMLKDVSFLMLVDLKCTMKRLVDTVMSNPGQIDTVIQIFRSLPELCRCRSAIGQPNMSLLVMSIQDIFQSSRIDATQQKNFIKFISLIIQDYKYQVIDEHNITESTPLIISEFIKVCIIPCLNSENLYHETQPISLTFTLKLFTTLLDKSVRDKPCDWLLNLNPPVLLLLISEVHNACLQPLDRNELNGKRTIIRQLVNKLLTTLKNILRRNSYHLQIASLQWFMGELEDFDWVVKIVYHKLLTEFITDGSILHKTLLEDLTTRVLLKTEDVKSLIQLSVINEECLDTVLQCLAVQESVLFTTESLMVTLYQILPSFVTIEWSRIYYLVSSLIENHLLDVPLRLLLLVKIIPSHLQDVSSVLLAIQLFSESVLMMSSLVSDDIILHVVRCYTALLQTTTNEMVIKENKSESTILLLLQVFGHICVSMATVAMECEDTLFVSLLEILGKVQEVTLKNKTNTMYKQSFLRAVSSVKDVNMQSTLLKRLSEIFM